MTELSYSKLPRALPAFGKLATSRGHRDGTLAEALRARAPAVRANPARVRAYARVCETTAEELLPVCYPQVLALPLQLSLMGHPDFPLPAMGLVHLANRIEQKRDLAIAEAFDVEVDIETIERTDRGDEFDLVTRFLSNGEVVWTGTAQILRRRGKSERKGPRAVPQAPAAPQLERWKVPANTGRRYARVSGDINPIHLTAASAKLLGFKRAIAHGMWTLARRAAALPQAAAGACALDVQFKTPIFLPAEVALHGAQEKDGFAFAVVDAESHKPHLAGRLAPLG